MRDYLARDYEPEVFDAVVDHCRKDTRALNVGAHVGYFARVMHDLGARVVAVEPDPINRGCLRKNCPEVKVLECAAGDEDGVVSMYRDWQNSGNSSLYRVAKSEIRVEVRRLDTALWRFWGGARPDFALFDCQGHDHLALLGCGLRRPPVAIVEHWERGFTLSGWSDSDICDLYEGMGYRIEPLNHENLLLTKT